jgi:hypothetical protein
MSVAKVVGAQQISLYQKLEAFCEMGVGFLLRSPPLRKILMPAVSDPYFVMQTGESYLQTEIDRDFALYRENGLVATAFGDSDLRLRMLHLDVLDKFLITRHNVLFHHRLMHVLLAVSMSLKSHCSFVSKKKQFAIN